ncbi:hypothetical protein [Sulfurivermis fontis]|uniref:hypothetical protein n=1 Tax=Sulfurivermis fontis TaxID=1972068 RepID=UPI000FD8B75D|nr:hypothetical protein [Sulfurivermis fontis]
MRYLIPLLCILCGNAVAADAPRHGFWGAIDVGVGRVSLDPQVAAERDTTRLNLALAGGYTLHPQLQLGIAAGGWSIRSGNIWDPSDGEGLSSLFAVARIWPGAESKLFFKLAGGRVTHWNNAAAAADGSGSAYEVGLGYEVFRYAGTETHWYINYARGSIDDYTAADGVKQDEDFSALSTGLTLSF